MGDGSFENDGNVGGYVQNNGFCCFCCRCHSLHEDAEAIFEKRECLCFDTKTADEFKSECVAKDGERELLLKLSVEIKEDV